MAAEENQDFNRMNPFGPGANADETRQAQHMAANDTPVDVNMNSVVCREQALTFTIAGQAFAANNDLRQKYADGKFGKAV
jgi:hypothetical protein